MELDEHAQFGKLILEGQFLTVWPSVHSRFHPCGVARSRSLSGGRSNPPMAAAPTRCRASAVAGFSGIRRLQELLVYPEAKSPASKFPRCRCAAASAAS